MWQPMDRNMWFRRFTSALLLFAAPASARETIGNFATWGAFCDGPRRCYAVSVPAESRNAPFLAVTSGTATPQLRVRVGRPVRSVTIAIGDQHFDLSMSGDEAIADPRTSRRIVSAMRENETLTVVARGAKGGTIRHHYSLAGAPSAIDAAALAALR
jgi:hypothetical protein